MAERCGWREGGNNVKSKKKNKKKRDWPPCRGRDAVTMVFCSSLEHTGFSIPLSLFWLYPDANESGYSVSSGSSSPPSTPFLRFVFSLPLLLVTYPRDSRTIQRLF